MSILDSASSKSVYRGYNYYKEGNVITYTQLSDFEYEGEVQGTNKNPYHVVINIKHPKSSFCDCPFANDNAICKHMVALLFAVSPEDLADYEEWIESDYEDDDEEYDDEYGGEYDEEYDDEYYYDYNEDYNKYKSNFVRPIFFDEILSNFVNNLSKDKLKEILLDELKRNEEYTLNKYLKKEFKKYCEDKDNIKSILDKINRKLYRLSHNYDYNNKDYTEKLLNKSEKEKISNEYINKIQMKNNIDKVILNPELATYDDYKWIATLYKNNNSKKDVQAYIEKLTSFLDTLKHYSIKNTIPKSNVLITIYLLNDYNLQETAQLLVKNCKYEEYVDYILENCNDMNKLYKEFNKNVESEKYINKEYIPKIYYKFYLNLLNDDIYDQYSYYSFLYNKNIRYLLNLKKSSKFNYYIDKLMKNTKDVIALENIYLFLNKKDELFNLLLNKENEYSLIANIDNLKDEYNNEILTYLKSRFYEVVENEKSRENYRKASFYVKGISMLNNGESFVNSLINELKISKYSKRRALFDEISHAIKNK